MLVVVALLAGAVVWAADAYRPADRFHPRTPGDVTASGVAEVGDTLYASVASSVHPVNVDDATLVVDDSSALAAVVLVACTRREGSATLGAVVNVSLSDSCESVQRPSGVVIGGPAGAESDTYLLAVIHPLEPGRLFIDGAKVTHSRGPFHRTEHTGTGIELIVT